jgi:serine/threonine protein kinase
MRDDDVVVQTAAIPVSLGMVDLSGSVVAGRYRLTSALGQGAMANVYRATDGRLDREVAVKVFHPGQDAVVHSRFGAEAQALARLSHPGLVGIYDAGVAADRPYLVMELVDGESLRERLLGGPLDSDDVVLLGAKLATALAHVHTNGIVHRDIKPSNIVLDGNGSPHLADFGIALLLDAARVTGSGEIMGTAAYLAPEQIMSDVVGSAADVYALGLVLLECLTGELEYPGVSKFESAVARLHRQPRIPDDVPGVLAELLIAMTARRAADRPAAGECAAWFWAAREHGVIGGRAARLAAADWFTRKTQPSHASVLAGWRRYVLAGAGLAMAVVVSTFLFTALLPRVMPPQSENGPVASPPGPIGSGPRLGLNVLPPPAMHMAAALTTTGGAKVVGTPVPVPTTSTTTPSGTGASSEPSITSTRVPGPTSTTNPAPSSPNVLQSSTTEPPLSAGTNQPPADSSPVTSPSPGDTSSQPSVETGGANPGAPTVPASSSSVGLSSGPGTHLPESDTHPAHGDSQHANVTLQLGTLPPVGIAVHLHGKHGNNNH